MTRGIDLTFGDVVEPAARLLFGERLEELTTDEIRDAIQKRLAALQQCVGWLYPSILSAELAQLRERHLELIG